MKATVGDAFYVTVLKSLRFHLSTLKTERFQNTPLLKPISKVFVFISFFEHWTIGENVETCAFSNENTLVSLNGAFSSVPIFFQSRS